MIYYRKLWETEDKVRYEVEYLPEEKYAVEFDKINNRLGVNDPQAKALAEGLKSAIIHNQLRIDPQSKAITTWPENGELLM
ncbi:hypothetical protein [Epidermidibacterium keratini]